MRFGVRKATEKGNEMLWGDRDWKIGCNYGVTLYRLGTCVLNVLLCITPTIKRS